MPQRQWCGLCESAQEISGAGRGSTCTWGRGHRNKPRKWCDTIQIFATALTEYVLQHQPKVLFFFFTNGRGRKGFTALEAESHQKFCRSRTRAVSGSHPAGTGRERPCQVVPGGVRGRIVAMGGPHHVAHRSRLHLGCTRRQEAGCAKW